MVFRNVICDVTISRPSCVFSQCCVWSVIAMSGLAVAAFDLVNCFLSVLTFVSGFLHFDRAPHNWHASSLLSGARLKGCFCAGYVGSMCHACMP